MHIQNVTQGELESALYWINEYFDNNIEFSKFVQTDDFYFILTLRVKDVQKVGHTIAKWPLHTKLPTACRHVHQAFFLELPDRSEILDGHHWYNRSEILVVENEQKYSCECEKPIVDYRIKRR